MSKKDKNSSGRTVPQYGTVQNPPATVYAQPQFDGQGQYTQPEYNQTVQPQYMMETPIMRTPTPAHKKVWGFAKRSVKITVKYLAARALVSLVMGFVEFVVFTFLKLPVPGLWAIILGVGNFIPVAGATVSTVIVCGILLFIEPKFALYAILTALVLQGMDDFLLTPLIVGRSMKFKPIVIILLTVLISIFAGGFFGVLFAIPIAAIIKLAIDIFYFKKELDDPDVIQ